MRKSELLKHIPDEMPEVTTVTCFKDGKEKILMVICPEAETSRDEKFVHFLSKTGYLTYYPKNGIWTREGYSWLYGHSYLWSSREDDGNVEVVRDFAESEFKMLSSSIDFIESEIRYRTVINAKNRKERRTTAHIQEVTPPLPKDFTRWAKGKKAVKLFQPSLETGVIERMFIYDKDSDRLTEICRAECEDYGTGWIQWCYGTHYNTYGKNQSFSRKKADTVLCRNVLPRNYETFDNFDDLNMTEAQRSCLRLMNGTGIEPSFLLGYLRETPELEYVIKGGYLRLAADLINRITRQNQKAKIKLLKKLSKKDKDRLRTVNGGVLTLNLLHEFPNISDANLKEFNKIKSEDKAYRIMNFLNNPDPLNLNHIMTLLRKTGGLTVANITMYSDYLDMALARGADIHDEIIYRNKRWREFHDRYVEEANREKVKQKAKNFIGIQKDYKRNVKLYGWEGKGFAMLVPRNYLDIVDEGSRQHHCVGASDTYMLRMASRESYILFLRHSDKLEEPYYTLEVKPNGQIVQAYAAYDRKPDYDEVSKILKLWQKEVAKRQRGAKACTK